MWLVQSLVLSVNVSELLFAQVSIFIIQATEVKILALKFLRGQCRREKGATNTFCLL